MNFMVQRKRSGSKKVTQKMFKNFGKHMKNWVKTWTFLNEHLFAANSPVFQQDFEWTNHAVFIHRLSKQGGWKDSKTFFNYLDDEFIEWYNDVRYNPSQGSI